MKIRGSLFAIIITITTTTLAEFPSIKAGHWKTSTTTSDHGTRTTETCIDESTMKEMLNLGQQMMAGACTDSGLKKVGDKYTSSSVCTIGPTKTTTVSTFQGDFSSSFTFDSSSKMEPPIMGRSSSTTTGKSEYLGNCPAEMKPGDVKMPDGKIMNPKAMMNKLPKDFMKNLGNMMKNLPEQPSN